MPPPWRWQRRRLALVIIEFEEIEIVMKQRLRGRFIRGVIRQCISAIGRYALLLPWFKHRKRASTFPSLSVTLSLLLHRNLAPHALSAYAIVPGPFHLECRWKM